VTEDEPDHSEMVEDKLEDVGMNDEDKRTDVDIVVDAEELNAIEEAAFELDFEHEMEVSDCCPLHLPNSAWQPF